jgi:hypothetical protein
MADKASKVKAGESSSTPETEREREREKERGEVKNNSIIRGGQEVRGGGEMDGEWNGLGASSCSAKMVTFFRPPFVSFYASKFLAIYSGLYMLSIPSIQHPRVGRVGVFRVCTRHRLFWVRLESPFGFYHFAFVDKAPCNTFLSRQ